MSARELLMQDLEEEKQKWAMHGMSSEHQVNVNLLDLMVHVHVLTDILIEKEVFTRDEFGNRFIAGLTERLKEARVQLMQAAARARILDSDGKPMM